MMTKIFGHRGAMGVYPENTLMAFEKAIDMGVDGLEVDVHMTKDGELVIIHDEAVERTTNGAGYVRDMTVEQIRQLSAGVKFESFTDYHAAWAKEKVPTLKEVLELAEHHDIEINIELKTNKFLYDGIEEKVDAMVSGYSIEHKVIYSSFHLPTIIRMKTVNPNARVAWLTKRVPSILYDYINTLKLDAFHLSRKGVLKHVDRIKTSEDKVRIWTVNDEKDAKKFFGLGVEALMTDYPEEIIEARKAYETDEKGI